MNTEKIIEIRHLSYTYPDGRPGLRDVDLDVFRHESVAILGPNGAGKSTLLYHLNGTLIGNGTVRIFGRSMEKGSLKEIRRRVGLVFQNPEDQLFCPTVFEDVAFGPINMGLEKAEVEKRVERALETMGLKGFEERSAHHLSEGEKKRVALATVLAMDSEILALDEPTDNLDSGGSRAFVDQIRKIPQTKVIVTHHLPLVMELCERAVLMDDGRKIEDVSLEGLIGNRSLLEDFGFDADLVQWMYERLKASRVTSKTNRSPSPQRR